MLPDLDLAHAIAAGLLLASWFSYSVILSSFARGSLNAQLAVARLHWISAITRRNNKPFDAVLLGHIINSVAFFGSATLLVLAAMITALAGVKTIHVTFSELHFAAETSLELFSLKVCFLTLILGLCFFSFTYALRKLIYVVTLVGALPDGTERVPAHDTMIASAAIVLREAVKTFNFGIRGYYYSVAAIFLFVSPYACMAATVIVTGFLFYRQLGTPTARAIQDYVEAVKSINE